MARTIDKTEMARKMFDEGEPDDLMIEAERSAKRVTIREESNVSIIKRRSPAQFIPLASIVKRSDAQVRLVDFDPEKYPEDPHCEEPPERPDAMKERYQREYRPNQKAWPGAFG